MHVKHTATLHLKGPGKHVRASTSQPLSHASTVIVKPPPTSRRRRIPLSRSAIANTTADQTGVIVRTKSRAAILIPGQRTRSRSSDGQHQRAAVPRIGQIREDLALLITRPDRTIPRTTPRVAVPSTREHRAAAARTATRRARAVHRSLRKGIKRSREERQHTRRTSKRATAPTKGAASPVICLSPHLPRGSRRLRTTQNTTSSTRRRKARPGANAPLKKRLRRAGVSVMYENKKSTPTPPPGRRQGPTGDPRRAAGGGGGGRRAHARKVRSPRCPPPAESAQPTSWVAAQPKLEHRGERARRLTPSASRSRGDSNTLR